MDDRASLSHVIQMMNGFRPGVLADRYVILCTKPDEEWAIAQLTTDESEPIRIVDDRVFGSVEAASAALEELGAARPQQ
jgi:hypothetical protein